MQQQQQRGFHQAPHYPPPDPGMSAQGGPSAFRYVALFAATVVALAAIVLMGVLLYPKSVGTSPTGTIMNAAQTPPTVYVPQAPSSPRSVVSDPSSNGSGTNGYSCGSTRGYSVWVLDGNVPCTSAMMVTSQWLEDGTTPGDGDGPAGTPYSWKCTTGTSSTGHCTSKMNSTFTING